jgi:hypothetical protein
MRMAFGLALITTSCGSDPITGPALRELQGEWKMSWTQAGAGVSCVWSDVTLSLRDSTKGPPGFWGGGQGSCEGIVDSDNLVLLEFVLDSLEVQDGRISFVPSETTYRFEGRVSSDEMNGAVTANLYYGAVDAHVPTTGSWQAVRIPTP